jgi:NAD(P)-dependent dehydrogenase (short-subunit alcohol dehydrogenase family)
LQVVHAHYDRIDGLVNNAGRSYAASVEEIDPAGSQQAIAVAEAFWNLHAELEGRWTWEATLK